MKAAPMAAKTVTEAHSTILKKMKTVYKAQKKNVYKGG
jgi:hypothetical protein